jgi:DNA-binding winged helix-turn-helix (wHTH) protein
MDDQSLRQLVTRTRRSLQQQFSDCCDRMLDQNDIIENVPNKGYRLNPKLVVQSLAILEPKPR